MGGNIIEELRHNQGGQGINMMHNNILLHLSSMYLYCTSYNNCYVDLGWFLCDCFIYEYVLSFVWMGIVFGCRFVWYVYLLFDMNR